MKWLKLYNKIGNICVKTMKNTDIKAEIHGDEYLLNLKFKSNGEPYLVEKLKYKKKLKYKFRTIFYIYDKNEKVVKASTKGYDFDKYDNKDVFYIYAEHESEIIDNIKKCYKDII